MRIYPLIKTDRTKEQLFPALMMTVLSLLMRIYPLIKSDRTKEQLFPALMMTVRSLLMRIYPLVKSPMTVRWTEPRGRQMEIILRSVGPVSRLSTQSRQQKGILVMNGPEQGE